MPKNKSHKGILKRVKLTKSGKIRHKKAFTGHIKSTKSGKRLRQLRMDKYMSSPEAKRLEKLLHRRLRGRERKSKLKKESMVVWNILWNGEDLYYNILLFTL